MCSCDRQKTIVQHYYMQGQRENAALLFGQNIVTWLDSAWRTTELRVQWEWQN